MIFLNAQFNTHKPVVVMEFGNGDIHLARLTEEDRKGNLLTASNGIKMPIGKETEYNKFQSGTPKIFMIFNNIESIDAVILILTELKDNFKVIELQDINE